MSMLPEEVYDAVIPLIQETKCEYKDVKEVCGEAAGRTSTSWMTIVQSTPEETNLPGTLLASRRQQTDSRALVAPGVPEFDYYSNTIPV